MLMHPGPAQVTLPRDGEVRVSRTFNARRDLVYRAFATPSLVQRWQLGPPGWTMPICEMDVRPGGAYRWGWRSDEDGSEFGFHGTFQEVDEPAKLVFTEHFDPGDVGGDMGGEALVTLTFVEEAGMTIVTTTIDYGSNETRDAAMGTGMTDGMEMSYQNLDELLAESG